MHSPAKRWAAPVLLVLPASLVLLHAPLDGSGGDPAPAVAAALPAATSVTALGRLEPKDGLLRVAGPSEPSVVISKLLVAEGDRVETGQVIALLDTLAIREAEVTRLQAELVNARAELRRTLELHRGEVLSDSQRDAWQMRVKVADAALRRAKAERERAKVRSPIDGQVIEVHAREGERVGPDGICELGRTDEMYAIAEVYETDVPKVKVGQHAIVTSPALAKPLDGTVERVGLKVGRLEALASEPAARTDARVVEVEVRLDESAQAAALTNLQVEVTIEF